MLVRKSVLIIGFTLFVACVRNKEFEALTDFCETDLVANATFQQVKGLYQGELLQIQEDWVIEGYVASSDKEGNFFSTLRFQDKAQNATEGFQLDIDLFESHLLFEPGQQIWVKTKGLYLGKSKGVLKLGGTFSGFGNTTVGRLPAIKIPEHVFRACSGVQDLLPRAVNITELDTSYTNTLVKISGIQFLEDESGKPFAERREETERVLEDCEGNQIIMVNSGFSNFQAETLPENAGSILALALRDNQEMKLAIRGLNDLNFNQERCADPRVTSNKVFFSELADPNNNSSARFVELYNASSQPIDLEGWAIRRYTNGNDEVSSIIDLTGFEIAANGTFVITPNAEEFEVIYGFVPDLDAGTNSPADSNGDDNLELVDPFGVVIDAFGNIGQDGSGTNHEFEDGRALRKLGIVEANTAYTFSEWIVFNDSGGSGTSNQPQNAPGDFNPGLRN